MDNEEWSEVDTTAPKEEKVEYEVEGEENEEDKVPSPVTAKEETPKEEAPEEEVKEEAPPELEGVQTKGAQKRIRQLVKQRKERDEQLAQLIKQNEELNYRLNSSQQQFNTVNKLSLDASEKQLTDKLELARNAYKSAHEEGDSAKILQAQEFLNEAQNDLKSLNVTKQQFDQQPVQQPQQPVQQQYQPQPTPDPRAAEWAQRNEWFGSDQVMTAASLAIDGQLKEEGFNPTDPEYYTEIDRRMQETFPHKFAANAAPVEEVRKQEEASKPAQVVAGASRSSPGSSKKVKLSKEDIRLANKWNIPLEQYALEKQKADKAEGEYTTINMQRGGK
jgi:hypothetical protein